MAPETAVDVKQAVANARDYLTDLFPAGETVQLEEVESLENGGWQVTLSFEPPRPDPYGLSKITGFHAAGPRVYKIVTLDPSGTPLSVKMR
jgi:hypothetical protein